MKAKILKKKSEKEALLDHLSKNGCSLMFFYEETPENDELYESVGESITLVHPPYDYKTLGKWLYMGNWQAISPANKDYQPFNTFKASDFDIERRMKEAKLKIIIDSFPDDIEWNVIDET